MTKLLKNIGIHDFGKFLELISAPNQINVLYIYIYLYNIYIYIYITVFAQISRDVQEFQRTYLPEFA